MASQPLPADTAKSTEPCLHLLVLKNVHDDDEHGVRSNARSDVRVHIQVQVREQVQVQDSFQLNDHDEGDDDARDSAPNVHDHDDALRE